jgi:GNAT superfamily N-acetyltransferase
VIHIRPAQPGDVLALAGLLGELGYPADAAAAGRRFDRLASFPDCRVLVATEDSEVIGFGTVHVFPILSEDAPRGQLTALVVTESARGRGVGRELVHAMEEFARSRGVWRIVVTTANHRAATHRFYELLGYQWTGRRYARDLAGS